MALFIGGDLGTSALKLLLVDEKGKILKTVSEEYPLSFPHPGWSEQNPADWWKAFVKGIEDLVSPEEKKQIKGIALDGQMHGLVALDEKGQVIRPAILWNDGRTIEEVDYLNKQIGKENLIKETGNIAYAGFTAPKILWMKKNEPELFKKIAHIMLPKDYLVYKLTGKFATEYSDAAGTLLLDVSHKKWSEKMLSICGVKKEALPKIYESGEIVSNLSKETAELLALNEKAFVCAGAADNAAAALGVGAIESGDANISLGTSGTIFVDSDKFTFDPNGAIHAFNSASGDYCLLACMLSAASCLKWLNETILMTEDYQKEQKEIKTENLGKNHVFFLPYLMGERSPINNPEARGLFIGLTMDTSRADMTQAVLEGVAFALKDSLMAAKKMGVTVKESCLTGGGSKSVLWRQILANILDLKLDIVGDQYGPAYGMAMMAMVAGGIFKNMKEAKKALIQVKETIVPEKEKVKLYEERYEQFVNIYPAVKELYQRIK